MPQYPRFHYLYPKNPIASARIIVGGDQSETYELSGRESANRRDTRDSL